MSDVTSTPRRRTPRHGGFVLSLLLCLTAATRLVWLVILPSDAVSADLRGWKLAAVDLFNNVNPYLAKPYRVTDLISEAAKAITHADDVQRPESDSYDKAVSRARGLRKRKSDGST